MKELFKHLNMSNSILPFPNDSDLVIAKNYEGITPAVSPTKIFNALFLVSDLNQEES